MANSVRALRGEGATRREYADPPVHEVILDVQFHRSIDEPSLRELREPLGKVFPEIGQQNVTQLLVSFGPASQPQQAGSSKFGGWICKDQNWVFNVGSGSITLHAVRPGNWPSGTYIGWEAISKKFTELHQLLAGSYAELEPKRAGLRYLNRIAIPEGDSISKWMELTLKAPPLLHDIYAFNLQQTWSRAGDEDDVSATVGMAKIEIEDPGTAAGQQGILLDIDIFNLWIPKAPKYAGLPEWFDRAHEVENQIFEGCITPLLRERFHPK